VLIMTMVVIGLVLVVVLAVAGGLSVWAWKRRSSFVSDLAEELYTKAQMDAVTRSAAQAMRDTVRPRPRGYGG
jgi:hypothetical protein